MGTANTTPHTIRPRFIVLPTAHNAENCETEQLANKQSAMDPDTAYKHTQASVAHMSSVAKKQVED